MWATLLAALGLMLFFEGLVFALAPFRLEDIVKAIRDMPVATRRGIGLVAMVIGVVIVWLAVSP
ncbi:MAG: DUF2065 domain-containing protein [Brevirhabdus sp.]